LVLAASAAIVAFPREGAAQQADNTYAPLTDEQRADLEKWWDAQPKADLAIPDGGARVLIVKFSDYMCPGCRQTYEQFKPVLGKYIAGGQVKFVLKHYPLEPECNANVPNGNHI